MACCGYTEGKNFTRVMVAIAVVIGTSSLAILLWPLSFLPGVSVLRKFCKSLLRSFSRGLVQDVSKPLFGGQLHCLLSARLLHFSPRLSRAAYTYFNLLFIIPVFAAALVLWHSW